MTDPCSAATCDQGSPATGVVASTSDPVQSAVGYLTWGVLAFCMFGLIIAVGKIAIAHSNREPSDISGLGACILAVLGAASAIMILTGPELDMEMIKSVAGIAIKVICVVVSGVITFGAIMLGPLVVGLVAWLLVRTVNTRKADKLAAVEQKRLETVRKLIESRNELAAMKLTGAIQDSYWLDEQIKLAGLDGER